MMYTRFMSEERRDRLLRKWSTLKFSDFLTENMDRHAALRNQCATASSIQFQLGESYQDDQHLRDTLLNACKDEKWPHRLSTIPVSSLLDVEESLAKAIKAEESMQEEARKSKPTPAFQNDVNFSERSGMAYRRYLTENGKFKPKFKGILMEEIQFETP